MYYNVSNARVYCITNDSKFTINGVAVSRENFNKAHNNASRSKNDVYFNIITVYGTRISASDINHCDFTLAVRKLSTKGISDGRTLKERIIDRLSHQSYLIWTLLHDDFLPTWFDHDDLRF